MDSQFNASEESRRGHNRPYTYLEYYTRPFLLIHAEYADSNLETGSPHPIRSRFWQLIPHGEYVPEEGRTFLTSYGLSVESELKRILRNHSIAYCLHLYRRLFPGPIGRDKQPATISLTRAALEAAIQKYAMSRLCGKIGYSGAVPVESILGGLLMSPDFEAERKAASEHNQLVLTDFSSADLKAFYDLEKLAYEVWKTAAALKNFG